MMVNLIQFEAFLCLRRFNSSKIIRLLYQKNSLRYKSHIFQVKRSLLLYIMFIGAAMKHCDNARWGGGLELEQSTKANILFQ